MADKMYMKDPITGEFEEIKYDASPPNMPFVFTDSLYNEIPTMVTTSIEQSRELLSLGLNPKSADMYWSALSTEVGNYNLNIGENAAIRDNLFSFRKGLVVGMVTFRFRGNNQSLPKV